MNTSRIRTPKADTEVPYILLHSWVHLCLPTYYDGMTAKALTKQEHKCGYCGLRFIENEDIPLHHIDGNHNNWKPNNLMAVHQSCHQYIHMSKRET
ncbi:MAG TPA: HNH endonuclease signature motif containing protein [Nodularia sp. (in: cyanobacteria)]|nr:HNH endonuclease signature motif containing protein [Nodularia sp. (in: cyanobacteria)]